MHVFADYVACKWRHSPFATLIVNKIINVGKQRFRISDVYLDNHVNQWCDNFKYLGVTFSCSDKLVVDIAPVQRCFILHAIVSLHVVMELLSQYESN